ncbi:MAG: MFS transporter [Deltaproteobacteria bacterium]|nr:MFS transporter [Deltaproteobacteria bacterium]
MTRDRIHFIFLNVGHFYDHLFILIFATVAALTLAAEWNMSYAELIPYSVPGFIAFGVGAIPAGWMADKWSRSGMMIIFFVCIGTSSILTAFAQTPLQIGIGLFLIGLFAAIYHPVGIAMVVHGREKTGVPLAINGIFGNMGVATAALIAGMVIDIWGWRAVFVIPGIVSIVTGVVYTAFIYSSREAAPAQGVSGVEAKKAGADTVNIDKRTMIRVFAVIFLTTGLGGLIFQSTTFALPKIFDERLGTLATNATAVGSWAFMVFAVAAFAQLVVGYLIDHYSARTVFLFVAGLQAVFFAAMLHLNGIAALIVSIAFMLFVFGQIPINDVLIGRMTESAWRSRAYALRYIITFTVSATAVPLIAWLHSTSGFSAMFLVMSGVATCIFLAVLMLPRTGAVLAERPRPAE